MTLTPEQIEKDHDCDIAGRPHKWEWVWVDGVMTDKAQCAKCGQVRVQQRADEAQDHSSQQ